MKILDLSRWNGEFDARKAKAAGVIGVIFRTTVGDYYTDPMFAVNWLKAGDEGLLRGGYHVQAPECSARTQASRYLEVMGDRTPEFPHTMDVELERGKTPAQITANLDELLSYIPRVRGLLPTIYTADWFWRPNILRRSTWRNYRLHVANYTNAAVPVLPPDWDTWTLWQWSADGNGQGRAHGCQEADVDLNRFNGSLPQLLAWLQLDGLPEPEPEVVIFRVAALTDGLRIRSTPFVAASNIIGQLSRDEEVEVVGVGGTNVWLKIAPDGDRPGGWCAFEYLGKRYVQVIE